MAYTHCERLSAMDTTFLAMEDGRAHMHVGTVSIFVTGPPRIGDGGIDFVTFGLGGLPRNGLNRRRIPVGRGRPVVSLMLMIVVLAFAVACGGDGDSGASDEECQEYLTEFQRVADELGGPIAPFMVQPGEGAGAAVIGVDPEQVAAREEDPESFGMTGRVYTQYHADVAPAIEGMIEGDCVDAYAEATRAAREARSQELVPPAELGPTSAATTTVPTAFTTSSTTMPGPGPRAGATYVGPIEGEPGLAAQVTLVVADSGEEMVELLLDLDMEEYACNGSTMSGGLGLAVKSTIPIVEGMFEASDGAMVWKGTFESELLATGTVQGGLPVMGGPPCELGPFEWTAEPSAAGIESPEAEASGPTATDEAVGTDLGAMFIEQFLPYPSMASAIPDEQRSCATARAAQRLTEGQIDELDEASPSPEVMADVAAIVEECLQIETVRAVLAAGLREGAGLTQAEADCGAAALADLSMSDFVVLIVVDEFEELSPELSQRTSDAIGGCFQ